MDFDEWDRAKDPGETIGYYFDWTPDIGTDTDQVLDFTAVPLPYLYKDEGDVDATPLVRHSLGPVKNANGVVTNNIIIYFTGGTLDRDYPVRLQVTIKGTPNQIFEQTMVLKVRDR